MTNAPEQPSRLDRVEALAIRNTEAIAGLAQEMGQLTAKVDNLTDNVNNLTNTATSVLGRSAILDDVILGLHETTDILIQGFEQHQRNFEQHQQSFERHQQNFENNQRSIEAALNRLEAMLLQIIRRFE
ncbi:hypothetical protein [Nostoc sp. FACHB-190]|uniref:hypothetical protein n=1 Tax=Nostoc sp. FACHB-190 TaxID=2692838 RepID=UPI0016893985|nr:hypothetical protein [Nostoc sp. FACHB-190]MBD2303044.1 hypothetical protein [Nostoc sp. FACHB-190]